MTREQLARDLGGYSPKALELEWMGIKVRDMDREALIAFIETLDNHISVLARRLHAR